MAHLSVRLFGPIEASLEGQAGPVRFPAKKTKALLGYLLINRKTRHSRERLAALWWGHRENSKARRCLNTEIWRLRRVIEPRPSPAVFLNVGTNEVGFNLRSDYWLDVEEFERQCELAKQLETQDEELAARALQRAVGLYQDELLPDCYEDWCLIERQRLQLLQLEALSYLVSFHGRRREFAESITCCQRILAHDSLREEIHRELIRLYINTGRPDAAMRQFRDCAALLNQELGVEPMGETLALIQSLPHVSNEPQPPQIVSRPSQFQPIALDVEFELKRILCHLGVAAESLALASLRFKQTLHEVKELSARLDSEHTAR
jgi:DNA-binding SARP family transcriptional activator